MTRSELILPVMVLGGVFLSLPAEADNVNIKMVTNCGTITGLPQPGDRSGQLYMADGKICVDAAVSVSASIEGFTPNGGFGTLTATGSSSASTAIPSGTPTTAALRITNHGSVAVSCLFATGTAVATADKMLVEPLSAIVRVVGSYDHVACIDQTGTTSNLVVLEAGAGLGNDSGGGGGGSGTSAAFDAAFPATGTPIGVSDGANMKNLLAPIILGDGVNGNNMLSIAGWVWNGTTWDRARGDTTNGAWVNVKSAPATLATTAKQDTEIANSGSVVTNTGSIITQLGSLNSTAAGPIPAGTNAIGSILDLNFGFVAGTSTRLKNTVTIAGTTTETLMAATASLHNYLTDLLCFRTDTGTTMASIALDDDASTVIPLPPVSGAAIPINVPIVSNGTNVAITYASQASVTGTCTARGYSGT